MPPLIKRIFFPVRAIVNQLLLNIPANSLSDPAKRAEILRLADLALINEFPTARAIPRSLRLRLISSVLDTAVGAPVAAAAANNDEALLKSLGLTPDELSTLENFAPGNSIRGFLVDGETSDAAMAQAAVAEVLKAGWTATATVKDGLTFSVTHADRILSVSEAWDLAHKLEDHAAIEVAEPDIDWVPATAEIGGAAPDLAATASFGGGKALDCSMPKKWNTELVSIEQAWALSPASRKQGKDVVIGHLDTGLTAHKHLPLDGNAHILLTKGANLYDPKHKTVGNRPLDPMDSSLDDTLKTLFKAQDGHGTQTVSVILTQSGDIRGMAPKAKVIPFRISPTVVNFNTERIAKGIRAAHQAGCDVITMSMGGPEPRSKDLLRAIQSAVNDGVIICTAAGNKIGSNKVTPIVVWPAAYDQVIAVAGSNCQDKPWSGSSRGPEVNITAPAESVWRHSGKKGALPGSGVLSDEIDQGEGTSYAAPTVASIAACWLAHHGGRAALTAHYGGQARYVPLAFAHILRTVGYRPLQKWDTRLMGPGIIHAPGVLGAALPKKSELSGWPVKEHTLSSKALANFFKAIGFVFGPKSTAATAGIPSAASASTHPDTLAARYGSELAYLLMDRPALLQQFAESGLLASEKDDGTPVAAALSATSIDLSQSESAITALRALASPSLAAALPQ